jgi:hypothetical protein
MASSSTTNCVNFTNDDCVALYGEPAFCQDEKCFCNRNLSFINADGKCGMFEKMKKSHFFFSKFSNPI